MNLSKKQAIKPIFHVGFVFIMTVAFIVLNMTRIINENSQVPYGVGGILDLILSVRSIYILFFLFLLLIALYAKFRNEFVEARNFKKLSFFILALFTGKFYTWGAFFIAWDVTAHFVDYVAPFPNGLITGFASIFIGFAAWYLARGFAGSMWRQHSRPPQSKSNKVIDSTLK